MNTAYRIMSTGSISAKLVVAIGQTLNANPFYLTGDKDENGECSETLIIELLKKHGYKKLLTEHNKAQKKAKQNTESDESKAKDESAAAEIVGNFHEGVKSVVKQVKVNIISQKEPDEPIPLVEEKKLEETPSILSMSDEDIMLLIRSLKLKAGIGVQSAVDALKKIDGVLLV